MGLVEDGVLLGVLGKLDILVFEAESNEDLFDELKVAENVWILGWERDQMLISIMRKRPAQANEHAGVDGAELDTHASFTKARGLKDGEDLSVVFPFVLS